MSETTIKITNIRAHLLEQAESEERMAEAEPTQRKRARRLGFASGLRYALETMDLAERNVKL